MKKLLSVCLALTFLFSAFSMTATATYGNDSYYYADSISVNQTYTGNLVDSYDEDWYVFTLSSPGYVSISFSHDYVDSAYEYWRVTLCDDDGDAITDYWQYKGNTTKTIKTQNIGLPAGTYHIKIEPYGTRTVNYKFKVNFTSSSIWERENNDYYSRADRISLNKMYYGTIMDSSDEDWYKFTLSSKTTVNIAFEHTFVDSSSERWRVTLCDDDGEAITDYWQYKGDKKGVVKTQNITLPKGTYHLKVEPYITSTVNYKIGVYEYIAAPKLNKIQNTASGVNIQWGQVSNATGYYVYRKEGNSSSWTRIAEISGKTKTSYTDKTAKAGKTYTYTVKSIKGSLSGNYNKNGIKIKRLTVPALKSVSSAKSGITFKWNKVTGASGYYVYRKTGNGSWKRIATVSGNSKVSYLDKSAKKGTTYTYTVRAYSGSYTSYYNTTGLKIKDKY